MNALTNSFFFDRTDLFSKIKHIETVTEQIDTSLSETRLYTNNELNNKISKFGDTLYGELILFDNATKPLHPVTKQQMDSALSNVVITGNLDW